MRQETTVTAMWKKTKLLAVAIFNFNGSDVVPGHGLDLEIGDMVFVVEECAGWYRGCSARHRNRRGIFPADFIAVKAFRPVSNQSAHQGGSYSQELMGHADTSAAALTTDEMFDQALQMAEDPIASEVVVTVREWHTIWQNELFLNRQFDLFNQIKELIYQLIEWRRQLISGTLTQDQVKEVRVTITQKLDHGNQCLGLDLVPRSESGLPVDPELMSPIDLYRIHLSATENPDNEIRNSISSCHSSSQQSTAGIPESTSKFIHLHVRDVSLTLPSIDDSFELHFAIYDFLNGNFVSEKFISRISQPSIHNQNGNNSIPASVPVCGTSSQGNVGVTNVGDIYVKSNVSTVFTDIGMSDVSGDLNLLIQVFRIGRMLTVEPKSKLSSAIQPLTSTLTSSASLLSSSAFSHAPYSGHKYKRPFACAIVPLSDVLKSDEMEKDFSVRLFSCSSDNDFYQVPDLLIRKQMNKLSQLQSSSLTLSLRSLSGPDVARVSTENPLIFKTVTCLTGKKGFPDVVLPGDVRNDLYLMLEGGDFEKGGKSIPKNIEAVVSLFMADGSAIPECLSYGTGVPAVTSLTTCIMYHCNNPRWNELIKVLIPLDVFDLGAHVRIEFRHCSAKESSKEKKLIGFSFIPLSDEVGTIISDGPHELYMYKVNDLNNVKNKLKDPQNYLNLQFSPRDDRSSLTTTVSGFSRSAKESIHVRTLLCSTKLTQNGDLLSLLKWRSSPETVEDALYKVLRLNGEEIVKFLQDILDALFSMFSTHDGTSTHYTGIVFKGLNHIFSLLDDPKYEHFKPVLDTYIAGHFAAALVHKGLMTCVMQCADLIRDTDKQETICRCFKSLEWIFKFIVQSRILFTRATGDSESTRGQFREDVFALFASFKRMLTHVNDPLIVPLQVTFLKSFSSTYTQLLRVLPPLDVALIIRMVISALSSATDAPAEIIRAKLKSIEETTSVRALFHSPDSRLELMDVFSQHLMEHMNRHQELKLCSRLVASMLLFLHQERMSLIDGSHSPVSGSGHSVSQLIHILVSNLFQSLLRVIIELATTTNETAISCSLYHEFIVSLISLLRLMEDTHFHQLMSVKNYKEKRDILLQVFYVFKRSFAVDLLPPDWSALHMVFNHVILCAMQELSMTLITDFLDNEATGTFGSFDEQLWNSYFSLSVSFLTQDCLQLEIFSDRKRESILDKYADMRVLMGFQILSMWEKLSDLKMHFIPSLVAPFLEVTLVPEKELRTATLPIFYDMMDAEFKSTGSFKSVECNLIDKLDMLVGEENRGDTSFKHLFMTILSERVKQSTPLWKEQGVRFIQSITKLLELLLDYRSVIDGDENRDKRMSCTVNLLRFYKEDINRSEMYIRYIHKLCDLHIPAENYTEAGFTLKLHADALTWSRNLLPAPHLSSCHNGQTSAGPQAPLETECQLKERLYLSIIEFFDKGKCWEEGIPLIKELATFYEKSSFDYAKLSAILKNHARFLDNILNEHRPEPEYFRVGYYGHGFPSFLRNKVFVYRGLEYEKMATFTTRLQSEFPKSQLLKKSGPPDESIISSDEQFLQIFSVKPVPEPKAEFDGREVPDKILAYYLTNDVRTFIFDRPIHKGPADPENEFKSLWIERSTLTTAAKLPGILRWAEVVQKRVTELSPLEHACESVENMNRELERLVQSYISEPGILISPLSMRLQGVIEAAVNGGIAKYQDAFFNPKYINLHPEQGAYIRRLKQLIMQKVRILEGGLSIHGRHAPAAIQPLHMRLVERFSLMRQNILDSTSHVVDSSFETLPKRPSILNTPLPPIPRSHQTVAPPHSRPHSQHPLRNSSLQRQSSNSSSGSSLPVNARDETDDLYTMVSRGGILAAEANGRPFDDDIYAVPLERASSDRGSENQSHCSGGSSSNGSTGLRLDMNHRVVVTEDPVSGGAPLIPERNSPAPPPPLPPTRTRNPEPWTLLRSSPSTPPLPARPLQPQNGFTASAAGDAMAAGNLPSNPGVHQLQRTRSMPRSMMPAPHPQVVNNVLTVGNSNFYSPDPTARSSPTGLMMASMPFSSSSAPPLPPRSLLTAALPSDSHRSVDSAGTAAATVIPEDMRPNLPQRTTVRKAISATGQMDSLSWQSNACVTGAEGAGISTANTTAASISLPTQRLVTSNGSLSRRPAPSPPSLAPNPVPLLPNSSTKSSSPTPPPLSLPPPPPHPIVPSPPQPSTASQTAIWSSTSSTSDDRMSTAAAAALNANIATAAPSLNFPIICDHEVESLPPPISSSSPSGKANGDNVKGAEKENVTTTVMTVTTAGSDVNPGSSISVVAVTSAPEEG